MMKNIAELRHNFIKHYANLPSPSDAFYLYNNGHQTEFFELLQMENVDEFQSSAYELLQETLLKKSSAKGTNISAYIKSITLLWKYLHNDASPYVTYRYIPSLSHVQDKEKNKESKNPAEVPLPIQDPSSKSGKQIPRPSCDEVDRYLTKWKKTPDYCEPDKVLKELFTKIYPCNTSMDDIILKAAALNTVYNTRITSIYPVALCIHSLDIDAKLLKGDETLINTIVNAFAERGVWKHYSFATKYCSFHNSNAYPIYDSYVAKILWYYQRTENFSSFRKNIRTFESFKDKVLKKDYATFKRVIEDFRHYFGLEKYTTKELDQYLWQFGKDYF